MYTWCPCNLLTFSETFNSEEDAIANAQFCYDNKIGYYCDDNCINSQDIFVGEVLEFDLEKNINLFMEQFNDFMLSRLKEFSDGLSVKCDIFSNNNGNIECFKTEAAKALTLLARKNIIFYPPMITENCTKYSLKYKKYL